MTSHDASEVGVTPEQHAGPRPEDLTAIYALEAVKGFGPQKFKALFEVGLTPAQLLKRPSDLPLTGKRAEELLGAIQGLGRKEFQEAEQRAERQLQRAAEYGAELLVYGDPRYPQHVRRSNNPVPVIYARGNVAVLAERRVVACVGSRGISAPYDRLHERFARLAVREEFTVASGFALGADSIGHRAARDAGGRTVCVMPNGLDRPFPPENRPLWEELLGYPDAVMISEFPFGRGADSLTLRKRNRLIVACALGVLVSQSSKTGGAMNAFRFAVEQRKPVATFEADGSERSSGNLRIRDEAKADSTALVDDEETWRKWLVRLSS